MPFERNRTVFDDIQRKSDVEGFSIEEARNEIFKRMQSHPWETLKAVDYDGTPIVRTKDEKDPENPFKSYPVHEEYLYHMVHTIMDPDIMMLILLKNRQIMASYTSLLVSWWKINNLLAQNVFISRRKKETSVKLMKDKIRDTHRMLPKWVKERWKLTAEPKDVITSIDTGSTIMAVPETFADSESRGDSASEIIVDECAFQDQLPRIITAALSMARRITLISTPSNKIGGQIMDKYIKRAKDNAFRIDNPCEGLNIIRAKDNDYSATLCVFEVIHRKKEQSQKSWLYLNDSARRQEEELSFDHTDGSAYFPEVQVYGGEQIYARTFDELDAHLPIERGFDFGVMRPACVWAQVDPVKVQIKVVRAIIGKDIDPWAFALVVRYLSGEISERELGPHPLAIHLLNDIRSQKMPLDPWFNTGFKFRNWGGHEAARPVPTGPGQKIETYAEIFNSYGLPLNPRWIPKERREFILRNLLKPRADDGVPGILVDPRGAPLVLKGISGGLVRPYNQNAKEIRTEEPMDDHLYKDVYDALGYILVGTFNHVNWEGIKTTLKGFTREGIPFEDLGRLPRWGDNQQTKRVPLVSQFVRW